MAKLLDIPIAIIFKKENDNIRVIVTNDDNEHNPFRVNDTIPIDGSFCNYVFKENAKLVVPDYREIDLDINNVATKADFISYLGYPLKWPDGEIFGTICFLDDIRNYYSNGVQDFLENMKEMLNDSLELIDTSYKALRYKNEVTAKLEEEQVRTRFMPMCRKCQQVQYQNSWINVNEFLVNYPDELVKAMPKDWNSVHTCKTN